MCAGATAVVGNHVRGASAFDRPPRNGKKALVSVSVSASISPCLEIIKKFQALFRPAFNMPASIMVDITAGEPVLPKIKHQNTWASSHSDACVE